MQVSREYVYALDRDADLLSVFFASGPDSDNQLRRRGAPFLSLRLERQLPSHDAQGEIPGFEFPGPGWIAEGMHSCGCDLYRARYSFAFRGAELAEFRTSFTVVGPEKDYDAVTVFTPCQLDSEAPTPPRQ